MTQQRREPTSGGRPIDPMMAIQVELLHAVVPDELQAVRDRLPQIRESFPDSQAVQDAARKLSRALDDMELALVRALHGVDNPDAVPRRGHR